MRACTYEKLSTPSEVASWIIELLIYLAERGVDGLTRVNFYCTPLVSGEPVELLTRSGGKVDILQFQGRRVEGYSKDEWDAIGSASRTRSRKPPSMSLADDFVLAWVYAGPAAAGASATHRLIVEDARFDMLKATYVNIDFGPLVSTRKTFDNQSANRRLLRIVYLLLEFSSTDAGQMEALCWLIRPNESLGWISPFDATADDEAFARACALVFLTGGRQVEPETIEEELFADFCASLDVLSDVLRSGRDTLLGRAFTALRQSGGSDETARLMLTCAPVSGERSATLYRLVRECDAGTINKILRTQFGYTGEGLDR